MEALHRLLVLLQAIRDARGRVRAAGEALLLAQALGVRYGRHGMRDADVEGDGGEAVHVGAAAAWAGRERGHADVEVECVVAGGGDGIGVVGESQSGHEGEAEEETQGGIGRRAASVHLRQTDDSVP